MLPKKVENSKKWLRNVHKDNWFQFYKGNATAEVNNYHHSIKGNAYRFYSFYL